MKAVLSNSLASAFTKLEANATKVNAATEQINAILKAAEDRLVGSGVGFECWLVRRYLYYAGTEGDVVLSSEILPGEGEYSKREHQWILGFAKVKGTWMLSIREGIHGYAFPTGDPKEPIFETRFVGEPLPLLKAPRHQRIEAIKLLPKLIERLAEKAQDAFDVINGQEEQD